MAQAKQAGRYQLLDELGRGAMGVVYKAHDPTIGRTVAVKTMRLAEAHTGLSHDELIARFGVETRAAGLLTHPNIVVVYDAGEDSGLFYITMEYVQGRSLQALIDEKQSFPLPRVLRIMEQAGAALDFAHQNNVVHRDIKPANLMITGDDIIKVTDFGTAKILQKGATQTGAILGTPSYMSPEQVKGKAVDGRSDIFSLGVILYELVTGEKPFPGQNVTTVIYKIVNEEPIPACELDESIHPGLNYVITKALNKDPDQRYQTCKELVTDLRNYKELGASPMDSATVVMSGRGRPKAVEEEIERQRSARQSQSVTPVTVTPQPEAPATRPLPRPMTLPPLTGSLPRPTEAPPKKSSGIWLSLVLLIVIGGAGYFIWQNLKNGITGAPAQTPAATDSAAPSSTPAAPADAAKSDAAPSATAPPASPKSAEPETAASAPEPAASALQTEIDQRIAESGLAQKLRARVEGRTVTLTGSLTPEEHRRLRARLAKAAPRLRINDQIRESSAAAASATEPAEDSRPKTSPGRGEIEVLSGEVLGATVKLTGPKGETAVARTPDRFEDLPPGRYQLEISKDGYRTERRIVNLNPGRVQKLDVALQAVQGGIIVNSSPANANIYINGQLREERTPATIRLGPGNYRVEASMEGYEGTSQSVQVQGEDLRQLNFTLVRMTSGRPRPSTPAAPAPSATAPPAQPQQQPPAPRATGSGSLEVRTIPPGADIIINGTNTGRKTPARMELPAGTYNLTIFLAGYVPIQRSITIEPNKPLALNEQLVKR